jgi:hypothetical protein
MKKMRRVAVTSYPNQRLVRRIRTHLSCWGRGIPEAPRSCDLAPLESNASRMTLAECTGLVQFCAKERGGPHTRTRTCGHGVSGSSGRRDRADHRHHGRRGRGGRGRARS